MEQDHSRLYGSLTLVAVAVVLVVAGTRFLNRDVEFCRRTFESLVAGKPSVQGNIAWDRLTAMGTDVGETYRQLPNMKERAEYQAAFIQKFAEGFKKVQGKTSHLTKWRVKQRGKGETIVAAEHWPSQHLLLFRVSHRGGLRLESIAWE